MSKYYAPNSKKLQLDVRCTRFLQCMCDHVMRMHYACAVYTVQFEILGQNFVLPDAFL